MAFRSTISTLGVTTLWADFVKLLIDTRVALSELPRWERFVHLFWLAGPFILLIERSPADIWLSLLALIFIGRAIILRDLSWLQTSWVTALFLFWTSCLLSAALSSLPSIQLERPPLGFVSHFSPLEWLFGWGVTGGLLMQCSSQLDWGCL